MSLCDCMLFTFFVCVSLAFIVSFSNHQLMDIIMTQSVHLTLFHMVVNGLPLSGKTTLCKNIGLASAGLQTSQCPFGLDFFEAFLKRAFLGNRGHQWMPSSGLWGDATTTALLHFLMGQHQLPKFPSTQQVEQRVFDDLEVQSYFESAYSSLRQLSAQCTSENNLGKFLTGSYSMVNVLDVSMGKGCQEILSIIGGQDTNQILLELIDVSKYDVDKLMEPLDLEESFYDHKCSKVDALPPQSALHKFVSGLEHASFKNPSNTNCIIVGTHVDQLNSETELYARKSAILNLIKSYASDISLAFAVVKPSIVTVDTRDLMHCQAVTSAIVRLIDFHKKTFRMNVPLRFMFFLKLLHNTKLMFISRSSLIQRARKCCIHDDKEIDEFINIFSRSGSILSSPFQSNVLYHHIVLRPVECLRGVCLLYHMEEDANLPQELLQDIQYGIISKRLMKSIWQGSTGGHMTLSDFYISLLQNCGLSSKCGSDRYYIPSLISKVDTFIPKQDSSSLIVTYGSYIPYRKLCEFVKYFCSNEKLQTYFELGRSSYCNTIVFSWRSQLDNNAAVTVRFSHSFIEVAVGHVIDGIAMGTIYSIVKTAVVDIMCQISASIKSFRFNLNIVCPGTKSEPKLHFIPFNILKCSVNLIQCPTCAEKLDILNEAHKQRLLWLQAAFTGSPLSAVGTEST